ncbi:hypothetical protein H0H92_007268 [Tricholoma furcatifolium]|nr:hypothetical protein H0H92_007268 [Tricholoma furcatifolium]
MIEFTGFSDGFMTAESYKRTVYRPPPAKFTVEMLPPAKIGSSYSYGMRICPVIHDHLAPSSPSEYEIWRRWEDCLIFQGDIEEEYRRLALAKRNRLARGQGIKRAGFYKQDAASSWESLPPGPDPKSVGREIYQYIPMLTRKGTVFRASQATIEKRAVELKAFVEAIWKENVPALIDEMREDRIIRDFFGYWRDDYEYHEKQRKQRAKFSASRTSMSSSIFSTYFSSSSNPSLPNLNEDGSHSISTPQYSSSRNREPPRYRKGSSSSSSSEGSPLPSRRRAFSTSSSNSSPSTPSDSALNSPAHGNVPMPSVADEAPTLDFHHNPHRHVNYDRPTSSLTILPEDREVCLKTDTPLQLPPVGGKRRKSSLDPDRQGRIFLSVPDVPSSIEEGRPLHNSWQSIDSAACVLEGLEHLTLSASPAPSVNRSHRESTCSVATFMTDASVDGVLPRERLPSPSYHKLKPKSRIVSGPVSISELNDNEWSDHDEDAEADDILDMFLTTESFPIPAFDIPHIEFPRVVVEPTEECPVTAKGSDFSNQSTPANVGHRRGTGSAATSTTFASSKSMTPIPDKFTIKAKFNDSLIILRVSDEIAYKDLRQCIFNKFVGQEGVALSEKFRITFLQPLPKPATTETTDSSPSSSNVDNHVHYSVTSAADWENVAASVEGYKLTLLITDDTA